MSDWSASKEAFLNSLPDAPPVRIEAFDRYLRGFPALVAVVLDNAGVPTNWHDLPGFSFTVGSAPLAVALERLDWDPESETERYFGRNAAAQVSDRIKNPFDLRSGASRRALIGITSLLEPLEAGRYALEIAYDNGLGRSRAAPKEIELVEPSEADWELLRELRGASWKSFLTNNWCTVDGSALSEQGQEALAFHLWLHRAIYGPLGLKDQDADAVVAPGPMEGEGAVYKLEMLLARATDEDDAGAPAAEKELLERWPGLAWRVEAIKKGRGRLATWRKKHGPERSFKNEPEHWPYRV